MEQYYLTPEQVAKRLAVSPKSIREWLKTNRLTGIKMGRVWRIRERDVEAFLKFPEPNAAPEKTSGSGAPAGRPDAEDVIARRKRDMADQERRRREWSRMTREERIKRVEMIQGKYADLGISVDEFLRKKHEDTEREERRWEERRRR